GSQSDSSSWNWAGSFEAPQMEGAGPGHALESPSAERGAAAARLEAGPGQARIEIVAAIGEHRPGLNAQRQSLRRFGIASPHRSRQPEVAVVSHTHRVLAA